MAGDALERLFNSTLEKEKEYSIDEQLDSITENQEDEFLEGMSLQSKEKLMSKVMPEEIKVEDDSLNKKLDEASEIDMEGINIEERKITEEELQLEEDKEDDVLELEENKPKRGRGRPPKKKEEPVQQINPSNSLNTVMDMLSIDIINKLIKEEYKIYNFNNSQMLAILNYMKQKF